MIRYLACFLAAVFKSKSRLVAENLWGANCYSRHDAGLIHILREVFRLDYDSAPMRDLFVLFVRLVVTTVRLMRPDGARAIVAESLLLKQQLLIVTRSRRRAPDLHPLNRVVAGLCAGLTGRAHTSLCDRSETRHDTGLSAIAREA